MTSLVSEQPADVAMNIPAAKALGSSFYWALRVLPKEQRDAMFRVYAFCRDVDDIADEPGDPVRKMACLQSLRADVEALFDGQGVANGVSMLKPVVERYGLDKGDLLAVIDGMMTDAHASVRIADEAAFDTYLDRVACAVGRMSDKVFGLDGETADQLAAHLGRALQITNILRDLREDANRDRLYIPMTLLRDAGIEADQPEAVLVHENFEGVLKGLAQRANDHFDKAQEILDALDRSKTHAPRIMKAVYKRVLDKLEARGLARTDVAVRVSKIEKLWHVLRHGVL